MLSEEFGIYHLSKSLQLASMEEKQAALEAKLEELKKVPAAEPETSAPASMEETPAEPTPAPAPAEEEKAAEPPAVEEPSDTPEKPAEPEPVPETEQPKGMREEFIGLYYTIVMFSR